MKWLFVLFLSTLGADCVCWTPNVEFFCGKPEISARALYWRNFGGDVHYATTIPNVPNDAPRANKILKPNYQWGWSGEVAYLFGCGVDRISLRYDQIYFATNSLQNAGDKQQILLPNGDSVFFVKATSNQRLAALDLTWTHRFFKGYCFRIDLLGAARYAAIDERIRSVSLGLDQVRVMRLTKFRGVGPAIGLATSYCFASGISVGGELSGSGLAGRRRYFTETTDTATPPGNEVRARGRETVIIPNVDAKAFARAAFQYGLCRWIVTLGYEMRIFSCVLYQPQLAQLQTNQLFGSDHLTFAGPYLSLAMRF